MQIAIFLRSIAAVSLTVLLPVPQLLAQADFLNRGSIDSVRVASYNLGGFIDGADALFQFENDSSEYRAVPSLARVWQAVDADVWAFQEIRNLDSGDIRDALNAAAPLGNGDSWSVYQRSQQMLASRYPIVDPVFSVTGVPRRPTIATVDLPNNRFDRDLHLINLHLDAGSSASDRFNRQFEADRIIDYLRNARDPSHPDALPFREPVIVLGDFNDFDETNAIPTLTTGNIINENDFGFDSAPDWDGTSLFDPAPTHNDAGQSNTTFQTSVFDSRLDLQLYTDSVLEHTNAFVLKASLLSSLDLQAAGLLSTDTLFDLDSGLVDHLPLVVDYEVAARLVGDFDDSGVVDATDIDFYAGTLGQPAINDLAQLDLDANGQITLADHDFHINNYVETPNGQVGTSIGDINLDGVTDVFGDGFVLLENLGVGSSGYSRGDLNADLIVDVFGDGFRFLSSLNQNARRPAAANSVAIPEPNTGALFTLGALLTAIKRVRAQALAI